MKTRVISGAVITVLAVGAGILGAKATALILLPCAVLAYLEIMRAFGMERKGEKASRAILWLGILAVLAFYLPMLPLVPEFSGRNQLLWSLGIIGVYFLGVLAIYVFRFPKIHADEAVPAVFAFLYGPVLLSLIARARGEKFGLFLYALIFCCTWICDTCAYFSGRAFGKHKLAPVLSPKKTIEGSIGGVVGSVIVCALVGYLAERFAPEAGDIRIIPAFAAIGLVGSLFSQVGDLAASAIKRDKGIKDYGNVIPGHGGIMDRFDSVIYTAPVIYFLSLLWIAG